MRLAISTYSFGPRADPVRVLEIGRRAGFPALELGSYTYWPEALAPAEAQALHSAVQKDGLALSIHFIHRGVDLGAHEEEARLHFLAQLQETVRLAGRLGARVIVVHLGYVTRPVATEDLPTARLEARALALDTLRRVAPLAEAEGVLLCVENLHLRPNEVVQSYREYVDFVLEVGSPAVAITLDFGHAHVSGGVEQAIATLGPMVRHLHIHDNNGQQDTHREIGRGTIPFERYVPFLTSFEGIGAFEVRDTDDEEGAVLRSLALMQRLLGDTRSLGG
ncbi:MAG: sugar phosphate isomerase/epimerase family protein [Dehalococcoidia bacterium]